ncbi:MAG: hypothetical protein KAS07_03205 [Candidatus Pacebacteria bacterium]|nr:hypothetical protein [Candidatus Paceibacterota bacterium]
MKKEKGSGLIIAVVISTVIIVVLFTVLIKPNTKDIPVEGIDPNKTILEQSGNMTQQAKDVKEMIEKNNDIEQYLQ